MAGKRWNQKKVNSFTLWCPLMCMHLYCPHPHSNAYINCPIPIATNQRKMLDLYYYLCLYDPAYLTNIYVCINHVGDKLYSQLYCRIPIYLLQSSLKIMLNRMFVRKIDCLVNFVISDFVKWKHKTVGRNCLLNNRLLASTFRDFNILSSYWRIALGSLYRWSESLVLTDPSWRVTTATVPFPINMGLVIKINSMRIFDGVFYTGWWQYINPLIFCLSRPWTREELDNCHNPKIQLSSKFSEEKNFKGKVDNFV